MPTFKPYSNSNLPIPAEVPVENNEIKMPVEQISEHKEEVPNTDIVEGH